MTNIENRKQDSEDTSSGLPFTSTTRRSILAASAAGIGSVALTTPVIGNPGEQGPYLTTDWSSASGVHTGDEPLTQQDLEKVGLADSDSEQWEKMTVESLPTTVHIHYTGEGGSEEASRLAEHLSVAQDHVHQYLKPPSEQEFVFILRPRDRVRPGSVGSTVSNPSGSSVGPGEDRIVSYLSAVPASEGSSGGNSDQYLERVMLGYFYTVTLHSGSLERFDQYRVSPKDSPWLSQGVGLYVQSTYGKSSAPYLADDKGSVEWAQSTVNSGSVDWETVNDQLDSEAGPVIVEYISEEWSWKKTLDMYFSGLPVDQAFSSVLGVTRAEFGVGLVEYMSDKYGGTLPEGYDSTQTETPTGTPTETQTPTGGSTDDGSPTGLIALVTSLIVGTTGGAAYYKRSKSPTQKKNTSESEE